MQVWARLICCPPRCLHHAILLAFSVDPGVRASNADGLCIPIAVASQRKQPALSMPMQPHICFSFPTRDRAGKTTSLPVLTINTEYELHISLHSSTSLIKAKPSDGEVHRLQGLPMVHHFTLLHRGNLPRSWRMPTLTLYSFNVGMTTRIWLYHSIVDSRHLVSQDASFRYIIRWLAEESVVVPTFRTRAANLTITESTHYHMMVSCYS